MNKRQQPYLFDAFPGLAGKVPWTPLGSFPTPAEKMEKLGERLGCESLWVKRDDLSGEDYGGNKVRKLEFVLADAKAKGRNPVITAGAVGSNHVLATTLYGAKLGLDTVGIFLPQPVQENLRTNILCNCHQGCQLVYVEDERLALFKAAQEYFRQWKENRQRPYFLWLGGSSTLGMLGYVEGAFEIRRQVREGVLPEPDFIFVPAGSGGSLAGLILGIKLSGLDSVAVGVQVVDKWMVDERLIAFHANRVLKYLRKADNTIPAGKIRGSEVVMLHDYFGGTYAQYTRKGVEAMALARDLEGLKLEGTYSGKAMAGFVDFMGLPARSKKTALFINTYNSRPMEPLLDQCPGPEILPDKVREYFEGDLAPVVD